VRSGLDNVSDVLGCRLTWFDHAERNNDGDLVKACQRMEVAGGRWRQGLKDVERIRY
jgi:hypothetical protein